jgi:hypothetical protein
MVPEYFRFTCSHLKIVRGGFFLRKKPLSFRVYVKSRIENAVSARLSRGSQAEQKAIISVSGCSPDMSSSDQTGFWLKATINGALA